jgi:hypothetical protein
VLNPTQPASVVAAAAAACDATCTLQVDDSRKTLSCAVTELLKDIQLEQQQHEQEHPGRPWAAPDLGIFVVHNKQRKKLAQLPDSIMQNRCAGVILAYVKLSLYVKAVSCLGGVAQVSGACNGV